MKRVVSILMVFTLLFGSIGFAEPIDIKHMDAVFAELRSISPERQSLYKSLVSGYFSTDERLDDFKTDYLDHLTESQLQKMSDLGVSQSDINDLMDALKTWTLSDRLQLLNYGFMDDQSVAKAGILALNEKNTEQADPEPDPTPTPPPSTGGSSGGGSKPPTTTILEDDTPLFVQNIKDVLNDKGLVVSDIGPVRESKEFADAADHWVSGDLDYLYVRGIISGKTEDSFDPDANIKLSEIVTMIVNTVIVEEGKLPKQMLGINGYSAAAWYVDEFQKAWDLGIISGDENGTVYPEDYPAREEIADVMVKTLFALGMAPTGEMLTYGGGFTDFESVSAEYQGSMAAAINIGLVKGYNGELSPNDEISRAEVATMMKRLHVYILGKLEEVETTEL